MGDSGSQATPSSPEILSGSAIPFRFEITWRSLTRTLNPAPEAKPPSPATGRIETDAREWEMVLPRMRRPAALPGAVAATGEKLLEAPRFAVPGESPLPRRLAAGAGAAVLLALWALAYQWLPRNTPAAAIDNSQWTSERASDLSGAARGRWLYLFPPAAAEPDYRFEFLGGIERGSLGWVFRAVDPRNYYAVKLENARQGKGLPAITRFAVIGGIEGPHIQRPLRFALPAGKMWPIRLEARGARFRISVENRVVDEWEDDRLKAGALGFLNEKDELGRVGSLRISYLKGGRR